MGAGEHRRGEDLDLRQLPGLVGRQLGERHVVRDVQVDIDPLDLAEQPASLLALRGADQPDDAARRPARAVLEVHAQTGFLTEFTAAGGAEPRMAELEVSVAAVLVAETCHVGFKPVTRPGRRH